MAYSDDSFSEYLDEIYIPELDSAVYPAEVKRARLSSGEESLNVSNADERQLSDTVVDGNGELRKDHLDLLLNDLRELSNQSDNSNSLDENVMDEEGILKDDYIQKLLNDLHRLNSENTIESEVVSDFLTGEVPSTSKELPDLSELGNLADIDNDELMFERLSEDETGNDDILAKTLELIGGLSPQRGTGLHSSQISERSYKITERPGLFNKFFNVHEKMYVIKLTPQLIGQSWRNNLETLFQALEETLQNATHSFHPDDLVRIFINQSGLQTPLILQLRPLSQVTVESILQMIEKLLQSEEKLIFDQSFEIHIATIVLPRGGRRTKTVNLAHDLRVKKSIITITNNDNLCLARSIAVANARSVKDRNYTKIIRRNSKMQKELAKDLCLKAGVSTTSSATLADVPKFEQILGKQIRVISSEKLNGFIYKGNADIGGDQFLYIYYHNSHFQPIVNVKGFYGYGYFCHYCVVPYYNKFSHSCEQRCKLCLRDNCKTESTKFCKECNRLCRSKECYDYHKLQKPDILTEEMMPSVCDTLWKCTKCYRILNRKQRSPKNHVCGESYCQTCKTYFKEKHDCYLKPTAAPDPLTKYIFFDFESTFEKDNVHEPNYCVAHRTCETCIDVENIDIPCVDCGQREFVFRGSDTLTHFCQWLFSDKNAGYTAMAHNFRSYDGYFVMSYLLKNCVKPRVIYRGSKIMYLLVSSHNIRFIDSLNHLPMSLSALPKAFGIESIEKGYFPHFANSSKFSTYKGEILDPSFYGADDMYPEARQEFLQWHEQQKSDNVVFDFAKELHYYCRQDVNILRLACLRYRKLVMQITSPPVWKWYSHRVDPFTQITLASLCMTVFKHIFLKTKTIARVPADGLNHDQYSKISILWLEYLMHEAKERGEELRIQHALNVGEKRIGNYRLDGFEESSRTMWDFLGCFYHGCKSCYAENTINQKTGYTMGELRKKVEIKQNYFRTLGINYVCIWECEFKAEIKRNEALRKFIATQDVQPRLQIRDAYYGGRTECGRLFYRVSEGEKIHYLDYTSLYPDCLKSGRFPLGVPEIITSEFKPIESYTGLAKIKVLPPRDLYMPLLPYRPERFKKLVFPLCKTCCEEQLSECNHGNEQRCWIGTYCTAEILKALELGYKVLKIYEVYHFSETTQFDKTTGKGGLFTRYIDTFLKLKQESSGRPDWVKDDETLRQYIQQYRENEGITLDKDKIRKNPGLRSISKNLLNSFYGKFAQRSNLRQSSFVTDLHEFYELLFDKTKSVVDVHIMSESIILVEWEYLDHFAPSALSSNVFLAAFTTCYARLKLYALLEMLSTRTLYMDTDSCIFISKPGDVEPETGDYLGQLTSETEADEHITLFLSGGCKNYAYRTNKGKEVCKVRGFSLTYKNAQLINLETIKTMVKNLHSTECTCKPKVNMCKKCSSKVTLVNEHKICRDKCSSIIYNRKETRDYRVIYDKRVILPDFNTVPYGYIVRN